MLDIKRFEKKYHQSDGKIVDKWKESLNLFPFTTNNTTSGFDKSCGLSGVTGEFFRKWGKIEIKPIQNFKDDVEYPVTTYLSETGRMPRNEQLQFMDVVKDILYPEGKLSVIDASFLPYLPLVDERDKDTKIGNKYSDGQRKIASYLYSMLIDKEMPKELKGESNLFSKSIRDGMERGRFSNIRKDDNYFILPFIKKLFNEDIAWLMEKDDYVVVKYINYFLYFFACLSISQTIAHLAHWEKFNANSIIPFYYMLSSEHASASREVVETGWEKWISHDVLQRIFAKAQALDILNTLVDDKPTGLFSQILEYLGEESFLEDKEICESVLKQYHREKYENLLNNRKDITENDLYLDFDYTVNSYQEFYQKLTKLCSDFISKEFKGKLDKKIRDLFEIKFLRNRRGIRVLVFDDDILIFLIAMITKEKRTKLDEMYRIFNSYGIFFDMNTRTAIESQLTKLNLLDRKSDSGEAQYVRVIL